MKHPPSFLPVASLTAVDASANNELGPAAAHLYHGHAENFPRIGAQKIRVAMRGSSAFQSM